MSDATTIRPGSSTLGRVLIHLQVAILLDTSKLSVEQATLAVVAYLRKVGAIPA